jgi:drug/metabolite transporter (DMT)-like permease
LAALLALISSVLWGTADFTGGTITRRRPALAVVGASQAIGLLTVAGVALATGAWHASLGYLPWGVAAGLAGFVGLNAFYVALASGTMGVVSPIASLGVIVPVVAGFLRGEHPGALVLAGIVVALVGIVLASGPELGGEAGARPVLLALGAALAFGISLLCITQGSRTSTVMTMTTMRVSTVLIAAVLALVLRTVGGLTIADLPLVAVAGVFDVSANLTFGAASTMGLVSVVAVLGSLYPVTTVLLARFLHGERMGQVQQAGVVAALVGVALIAAG